MAAKHNNTGLLRMTWEHVLFMHWPVPYEEIRPYVPESLELDTFQGQAYIAVVPFVMRSLTLTRLPVLGRLQFPELNLRTYVTYNGKPGVYFLHLDSGSRVANRIARRLFHLNYQDASFQLHPGLDTFALDMRHRRRNSEAEFAAQYGPASPMFSALKGSFNEWCTERYRFFSVSNRGHVYEGALSHPVWRLQEGSVNVRRNTLFEAFGLTPPIEDPHVLYSRGVVVSAKRIRRIDT
ncbi:hypothetical protein B0H94_105152 [Salsuginibacillus halophilus]|uniref:DUF2071 domain-containing protein n=1 Tax=Salsuginibacillus halophilus TaxID=517424 RepID=A0A2P8HLA4_9BACI|nr:DUF2071 domain-containing protein [Salsuginibacillus halophilus]PSL46999.1 hypothetical protein B0H94_105152 [Salsuginibacillus halophilus]